MIVTMCSICLYLCCSNEIIQVHICVLATKKATFAFRLCLDAKKDTGMRV